MMRPQKNAPQSNKLPLCTLLLVFVTKGTSKICRCNDPSNEPNKAQIVQLVRE